MLLFTIQHTLYKKPNLNKDKAMHDMTIHSTVSENGHVLKEKWETLNSEFVCQSIYCSNNQPRTPAQTSIAEMNEGSLVQNIVIIYH